LKFRSGELAKLAELQRHEALKRKLADPPAPLFKEVRELVLRKCKPDKEKQIAAIFENQPFGELELLVTQKLLDVVKKVARQELESENWLHLNGQAQQPELPRDTRRDSRVPGYRHLQCVD
jgi:hypothetical protein